MSLGVIDELMIPAHNCFRVCAFEASGLEGDDPVTKSSFPPSDGGDDIVELDPLADGHAFQGD